MRRKESGFVLVMALWFIAILTIAASYFADRVGRAVDSAAQSQRLVAALTDMSSTRAEVMYHIAMDGFSPRGLGLTPETAIHLDNRPYRGVGSDLVQLQDNRGLLNLNFPDRPILQRLLLKKGVPAEKHPALFDALMDYLDIDNFRRLNGAEAEEYRAANLPPPPNEWLTTPLQLQAVYGWAELTELWRDERLMQLFSVSRMGGFNPSTAPREILEILTGKEHAALLDEIILLRKTDPEMAAAKAHALVSALAADSEGILRFPANSIRITQSSPDVPWAIQTTVSLTTMLPATPWHIDYYAKVRAETKGSDDKSIPRLPLPSAEVAALAQQIRAAP